MSPIVSTALMISAILVVVIAVMGYATILFNSQTNEAEFSQAQNLMVNFAQNIDAISGSPGASNFVTFNARAGGPTLVPAFDKLDMKLNLGCKDALGGATWKGSNKTKLFPTTINALRYRAGPLASYSGFKWIRGITGSAVAPASSASLIVQNSTNPNGWVYVSHLRQSDAGFNAKDLGSTWVTLDYRRVNALNLGIFNVSKGVVKNTTGTYPLTQLINIVQISYTNITIAKQNSGANNIVTSAQNIGVAVDTCYIDSGNSQVTSALIPCPTSTNPGAQCYPLKLTLSLPNYFPIVSSFVTVKIPYIYDKASYSQSTCAPAASCKVSTLIQFVLSTVQLSLSGG